MSEEENKQQEENTSKSLPLTVWDEYDGHHVVLQLKIPYFAVTAPGVPASVEGPDGSRQFLQLPVMAGILRVKSDQKGGVRITMLLNDPDEAKNTKVRADIDPDLIAMVSVTPEEPQQQQNLIVP